jgi:hypothetical protein
VDFNAVAAGLEASAKTTGLNAFAHVPDSLPTWAFYVGEMDIDLDVTFRRRGGSSTRRGTDQATITCRVLVARFDDKQALIKLREYMGGSGPKSIVQAISDNRNLASTAHPDGACHDSQVKTLRGNRMFQVGQERYYGIELDVFVIGDA